MPTSAEIRSALLAQLTSVTGVTNWENIGFSMLPSDAPSGFVYRMETSTNKTTKITIFAVGIGVAATSISGLYAISDILNDAIAESFGRQQFTCPGIGGNFQLLEPVREEFPDSYPNQNVTSTTEAFRTVLTFAVRVETEY